MQNLGVMDGETQLIGLFATPIRHSLSPTMHNLAFKKLGLNYVYLAFEVGNGRIRGCYQRDEGTKCTWV